VGVTEPSATTVDYLGTTYDLAPVCCNADNTCFRRYPDANDNADCVAGVLNQGSFVGTDFAAADAACKAVKADSALCRTPPSHSGFTALSAPNCRNSGCDYDYAFIWTDIPCAGYPTEAPTDTPTETPPPPPSPFPTTSTTTTWTKAPTFEPTFEPTSEPTSEPTIEPTTAPPTTAPPTTAPTDEPTEEPSSAFTGAPTAFPACGVQVFRGTVDNNNEPMSYCETDPFKEKSAWGNRIAFGCCDEENACARHDKDGVCYSAGADAAWAPHSWFAAHDKCAKLGKKLCDVEPGNDAHGAPICKDSGCSYNYYAVWTNIACTPDDPHAPNTAECQGTAGAMCTDDWTMDGDASKDCAWVTRNADKLAQRCKKKDANGKKAKDPSACCGCQGI